MIIISLAKVLSGDIGVCKHEDGDYDQKSANCQKKIFEGVILLHLDDSSMKLSVWRGFA